MEPFIPLAVTQALQALGNLSLVIIVPCTIFNTLNNLAFREQLKAHVEFDLMRFDRLNQDVGKLYSLNDLRNDNANNLTTTLEQLLRKG